MSKKVSMLLIVGLLLVMLSVSTASFAGSRTLKVTAEAWYFNKYAMEEAAKRFQVDHPEVTFEWSKAGDFEVAPLMLAWSRDRYIADIAIVATPRKQLRFRLKTYP